MSLEYIDIGNPGAPNVDPTTGQPYNPNHLLIPAHINQPGGVLVIFNNSTNDLFFTFTYNRYRIKVPATQSTGEAPNARAARYLIRGRHVYGNHCRPAGRVHRDLRARRVRAPFR